VATLFEPVGINGLEVMNRAVRSATYEGMGDGQGAVTPPALELYRRLSEGELGTIITGYIYVCQEGKGTAKSLGIDRDDLIPGLAELASVIRANGSRAIFQLVHAGLQTTKDVTGSRPVAPVSDRRNPLSRAKPQALAASRLRDIAGQFGQAARRAREAGADGVQLHAAHGYLLSGFLSPFTNTRTDDYGGSEEGRYRLIHEVIEAVQKAAGADFPLWIKMNVDDLTPEPGVTPELAARYARRMLEDGVACLEVSAGSSYWAPFAMCRGGVPAKEMGRVAPWPFSAMVARTLRRSPAPAFAEAYNLPEAQRIRQEVPDLPLAVVGGMRSRAGMEECLSSGATDLVSLSRPLVREPGLVRRFREGRATVSSCTSCTRCLAASFNGLPLACYARGLPRKT
jgi:2,4-dienoyl-CoA reductase-like NADH-dependent reductase (Old Yellow Enzyme family)